MRWGNPAPNDQPLSITEKIGGVLADLFDFLPLPGYGKRSPPLRVNHGWNACQLTKT